jgi:hypothetical protein
MALRDALLPEFDHEMANTRKTLERVPDDKLDWKPHVKSTAMGGLATHLGNLPTWANHTIAEDALDLAPRAKPAALSRGLQVLNPRTADAAPEGKPLPPAPAVKTRKELLELFDSNVTNARAAIATASDEDLFKPWTLLNNGKQILTLPKIAVLRSFVMNHNIHHRAQLGVYLRLNDIPVPSIYGPSADEGAF